MGFKRKKALSKRNKLRRANILKRDKRIKEEISKIYPERDLPDDFRNGFGGKDYFLP